MDELERQDSSGSSEDTDFSPISVLLDETLEEIFKYLPGREQLNCRFVCHRWNDLLCNCSRLLQKNVQLSIDINRNDVNLNEHELIPIIKANKALKVKRLSIDCDVFAGEEPLTPKTVINFIKEHGIHDMVETFCFSVTEECNCVNILYEFLSALTRIETFQITTSDFDAKTEKYVVFDDRWQNSSFPTIKYIRLEVWGIEDNHLWGTTFNTFLTTILGTMPNIKSIIDIQGYNKDFYDKYAQAIVIDRLNIHEIATKIVNTKNLSFKELRLFGDSDYAADDFWHRLNQLHPEIESLFLSYNTKGAPVPVHNYSKVTHVDLTHSFGDASEGDLGGILSSFPSIKNLAFDGTVTKTCFFGHNLVELNHLTKAKVFLEEDCKMACDECIEAYTKCLRNVEDLNIDVVTTSLLKSISRNMTKLKMLSFSVSPDASIFGEWPEMRSLEHVVFRYSIESITVKDIQTIYKMCPKLENLQFVDCVSIKN